MSTLTTNVADQLRELATTLDNADDDTDVVEIIRGDESVLRDIATEWPYTLTDILVTSDPEIVNRAILDQYGVEGLVEGSEEALAEHLVQDHADLVRDMQERHGETSGVDAEEVDRLATELEGLASDVGYVRNSDLDEAVDELDTLSHKLSLLADDFKNLL